MNICGECGCVFEHKGRTGLCLHGHDHWIQPQDFFSPELNRYIEEACSNLGVSREELQEKCFVGVSPSLRQELKLRAELTR